MAMRIKQYGAKRIPQYGPTMGRIFTPYCPGGRHGHRFRRKKMICRVVEIAFWSYRSKARNGPSTQLIEATRCVERSNLTIKANEQR